MTPWPGARTRRSRSRHPTTSTSMPTSPRRVTPPASSSIPTRRTEPRRRAAPAYTTSPTIASRSLCRVTNPSLSIGGFLYTVINTLGVEGDAIAPPATPSLQGVTASNLAGHYALGSNIDASATSTWNAAAGFMPIGTVGVPFNGTFDGARPFHHRTFGSIGPRRRIVGLFGSTGTSSLIRNVGLIGGSVVGPQQRRRLGRQQYGRRRQQLQHRHGQRRQQPGRSHGQQHGHRHQ